MVCAYYDRTSNARAVFESTSLATNEPARTVRGEFAWDVYLGTFDVVRLSMTDFLEGGEPMQDMLGYLTDEVAGELMEANPEVRYGKRISLRTVMAKVYAATGCQFVVVIDEWDAVFRQRQGDEAGQREFLNFLRDWLKDKPYVALAYMTGILPIKKYGQHSALNMFTEYSMMFPRQLARYTGFTECEVRALCERYGRDDVLALLIHLGYLGYDSQTHEVFVPNREVLDEFRSSTRTPCWSA